MAIFNLYRRSTAFNRNPQVNEREIQNQIREWGKKCPIELPKLRASKTKRHSYKLSYIY